MENPRSLLSISDVAALHGEEILHHAEHVTERYGLSTGYDAIDSLLRGGGLLPGLLYTVGGRPGIGKSQFLLNILLNIAQGRTPVALFSLELSKERVLERLAYMIAEVDYLDHWKNDRAMSKEELKAIEQAIFHLKSLPIYIRDTVRLRPNQVRETMMQERDLGVQVIAVDYLHIMGVDGTAYGRERQIGATVEAIRDNAKDLGVACLLACQLNRATEDIAPYIPHLGNFRDSGAIEQVSYVVMALYRQDYYAQAGMFNPDEHDYITWNPDGTPLLDGKLDVKILKNQDGAVGTATLNFNAPTGRITK